MKADMMAVHQIQSLGAKQDILRDVVIKYIDHFYPEWVSIKAVLYHLERNFADFFFILKISFDKVKEEI